MKIAVAVLVCCFAAVHAFPPPPMPIRSIAGHPMVPGYELLPADVQAQLKKLVEDQTLGWQERHEKIFEIMENLPDEIKSQLPPPPGFEKLPADVQEKLKAIHMDRTLTWQQKHQKVREIIDNLPEEVKRLLPIPPPPPGFELLPEDIKAQIKAIHENSTLGWREKHDKIRQIMESLPEAIKSKLPFPPAPPGFELLPEDVKQKMKAIHEDKTLTHRERFEKIHEIMENLPADIKSKLPPPPPMPMIRPPPPPPPMPIVRPPQFGK